jgi:hypothetical protein
MARKPGAWLRKMLVDDGTRMDVVCDTADKMRGICGWRNLL